MEIKIGEKIKKYRKEIGYTQKQLAEKCGLSEISIKKYETGNVTPSYESLNKVCSILNVELKDILSSEMYKASIGTNGEITFIDITPKAITNSIHFYVDSVRKESIEGGLLNHEKEIIFNMMVDMYISFYKNINKTSIHERMELIRDKIKNNL